MRVKIKQMRVKIKLRDEYQRIVPFMGAHIWRATAEHGAYWVDSRIIGNLCVPHAWAEVVEVMEADDADDGR